MHDINQIPVPSNDSINSSDPRRDQIESDVQSNKIANNGNVYKEQNSQLNYEQRRRPILRQNEAEDQRRVRLTKQRERSGKNRSSKKAQSSMANILQKRYHSESARKKQTRHVSGEEIEMEDVQHQQQFSRGERRTVSKKYSWPSPIPMELKYSCLQDFCDQMSMPSLRESTCVICNTRVYSKSMNTCSFQKIPNPEKLTCAADVIHLASNASETMTSTNAVHLTVSVYSKSFFL